MSSGKADKRALEASAPPWSGTLTAGGCLNWLSFELKISKSVFCSPVMLTAPKKSEVSTCFMGVKSWRIGWSFMAATSSVSADIGSESIRLKSCAEAAADTAVSLGKEENVWLWVSGESENLEESCAGSLPRSKSASLIKFPVPSSDASGSKSGFGADSSVFIWVVASPKSAELTLSPIIFSSNRLFEMSSLLLSGISFMTDSSCTVFSECTAEGSPLESVAGSLADRPAASLLWDSDCWSSAGFFSDSAGAVRSSPVSSIHLPGRLDVSVDVQVISTLGSEDSDLIWFSTSGSRCAASGRSLSSCLSFVTASFSFSAFFSSVCVLVIFSSCAGNFVTSEDDCNSLPRSPSLGLTSGFLASFGSALLVLSLPLDMNSFDRGLFPLDHDPSLVLAFVFAKGFFWLPLLSWSLVESVPSNEFSFLSGLTSSPFTCLVGLCEAVGLSESDVLIGSLGITPSLSGGSCCFVSSWVELRVSDRLWESSESLTSSTAPVRAVISFCGISWLLCSLTSHSWSGLLIVSPWLLDSGISRYTFTLSLCSWLSWSPLVLSLMFFTSLDLFIWPCSDWSESISFLVPGLSWQVCSHWATSTLGANRTVFWTLLEASFLVDFRILLGFEIGATFVWTVFWFLTEVALSERGKERFDLVGEMLSTLVGLFTWIGFFEGNFSTEIKPVVLYCSLTPSFLISPPWLSLLLFHCSERLIVTVAALSMSDILFFSAGTCARCVGLTPVVFFSSGGQLIFSLPLASATLLHCSSLEDDFVPRVSIRVPKLFFVFLRVGLASGSSMPLSLVSQRSLCCMRPNPSS